MTSTSSQRRRGRRDQEARARLVPLVASGTAVCSRCLEPIDPTEPWDAGHIDDLALGGAADGAVAPEHRSCNRRAGARLGLALRSTTRRRRRPEQWLDSASAGPVFFQTGLSRARPVAGFLSPNDPAFGTATMHDHARQEATR